MKTNNRLIYLLIIILTIWCIVLTTMMVDKDDSQQKVINNDINVTGFSTDFTNIVEQHKNSIVTINASGNISTGFIYKQDGENIYILTSYHGLADANSYYVYFANNFGTNADLCDKNIYADLAVLKVISPYDIEPLVLADSKNIKSGEFIISIGTPVSIDYQYSVELGMISNPLKTIENSVNVENQTVNYNLDVIQLSSNLKPGYSGSPLLNMNGEVVGMTTMALNDSVNFAIPANEIKIISDKIINGEQIIKYQLGIKGSYVAQMPMFVKSSLNLPVDLLTGLYVDKLSEDCLPLIAGVKNGDVLLSINEVELTDADNYLEAVYTQTDSFEFVVSREGETLTFKVDLND